MIIDLQRFIAAERPYWNELERMLNRFEGDAALRMELPDIERFYELYERSAASLAKLTTFSSEPETRRYLESLIARAYGEIHETRAKRRRIQPLNWFFQTFPRTFRKHIGAFALSLAITLAGTSFGAFATVFDPESRSVTMPFGHDQLRPSERVHKEESANEDRLTGHQASFSASLMTHNIQVSILTLALGMTWGVGSSFMLFYNGIALGAIGVDYIRDGQVRFLLGWLMPHGVIEIPAILIAGQAGLVLASGLIRRRKRVSFANGFREVTPDVMTLSFGFAIMLVWAGFIESFLSQYHEPVIPYEVKMAFGAIELAVLLLYLARSGK